LLQLQQSLNLTPTQLAVCFRFPASVAEVRRYPVSTLMLPVN
jgi:hypothetical protein